MSDPLPCPHCGENLIGGMGGAWWKHPRNVCFHSEEYFSDHRMSKWNTRAPAPSPWQGIDTDCRQWRHYPIEMPLSADAQGPATVGVDAVRVTYEVWDRLLASYASFDNLPDAINEAMRLNAAPPPADEGEG